MDTRALSSIGWLVRREAARLGWRGVVGIVLIIGAVGFWLLALRPMRQQGQVLHEQVTELRTRLRAGGEASAPVATRSGQLDAFYGFFPRVDTLPDWIGRVHVAAARNGLVLETGEYQLEHGKDARLARYQITLPIKGTYPQLRGFVAEVLEKVPAAGLEDVVIKREAIGVPTLDAQLRFVVYLGGAS